MSIHVCKCVHRGEVEYHLRYPSLTAERAQAIADLINDGRLDMAVPVPVNSVDDMNALAAKAGFLLGVYPSGIAKPITTVGILDRDGEWVHLNSHLKTYTELLLNRKITP